MAVCASFQLPSTPPPSPRREAAAERAARLKVTLRAPPQTPPGAVRALGEPVRAPEPACRRFFTRARSSSSAEFALARAELAELWQARRPCRVQDLSIRTSPTILYYAAGLCLA
jgi:hypothetical protein